MNDNDEIKLEEECILASIQKLKLKSKKKHYVYVNQQAKVNRVKSRLKHREKLSASLFDDEDSSTVEMSESSIDKIFDAYSTQKKVKMGLYSSQICMPQTKQKKVNRSYSSDQMRKKVSKIKGITKETERREKRTLKRTVSSNEFCTSQRNKNINILSAKETKNVAKIESNSGIANGSSSSIRISCPSNSHIITIKRSSKIKPKKERNTESKEKQKSARNEKRKSHMEIRHSLTPSISKKLPNSEDNIGVKSNRNNSTSGKERQSFSMKGRRSNSERSLCWKEADKCKERASLLQEKNSSSSKYIKRRNNCSSSQKRENRYILSSTGKPQSISSLCTNIPKVTNRNIKNRDVSPEQRTWKEERSNKSSTLHKLGSTMYSGSRDLGLMTERKVERSNRQR